MQCYFQTIHGYKDWTISIVDFMSGWRNTFNQMFRENIIMESPNSCETLASNFNTSHLINSTINELVNTIWNCICVVNTFALGSLVCVPSKIFLKKNRKHFTFVLDQPSANFILFYFGFCLGVSVFWFAYWSFAKFIYTGKSDNIIIIFTVRRWDSSNPFSICANWTHLHTCFGIGPFDRVDRTTFWINYEFCSE